jgi:hypothetical protein
MLHRQWERCRRTLRQLGACGVKMAGGRKSRGRRVAVHVAVLGVVDRESNLNNDDHREPNTSLNTNGKSCSVI